MADSAEVKLSATTGPATDAMSGAASSIADSLKAISTQLATFGAKNKDVTDQAIRNNADLSRSFVELRGSISKGYDAIAGTIERVRGVSTALVGILAGGALWHEAIASMTQFNHEVESLENIMGLASGQATELAVTLKLAGSSADAYTGIALRMGRQLKQNEENFKTVGIATRDASGNLLPLQDIMQNAFLRMQDFKAGTDQAEFALTFFGRNVQGVYEIMARYNSANGRAKQLIHDLGIEWGPDKQEAVERYRLETAAFSQTLQILASDIGQTVLPRLEQLGAWMNSVGPQAAAVIADAMKVIATVITVVGTELGVLGESIGTNIAAIIRQFQLLGTAIVALANRDWGGVATAVRLSLKNIVDYGNTQWDNVVTHARSAAAAVGKLWTDIPVSKGGGPGPLKSGGLNFPTLGTGAEQSALPALDAELARQRGHYEAMKTEQGSFESWSLEQTRNYWLAATLIQGLSAKDREEIERKYWDAERKVREDAFTREIAGLENQKAQYKFNYDARIALAEQEYKEIAQKYGAASAQAIEAEKRITEEKQRQTEQRIRLADLEQKAREQTSKFGFEQAKAAADQQVALGQISVQQRLAIERDYLTQEFGLERDALQQRIDLMASDPNSDPVKLQELKNQLLTIEQNYQKQVTDIDNKAVLDRKQYAIDAANAIRSAMENALASMTDASKSWKDKFLSFAKEIQNSLDQIAAKQIIKQLFGPGTSGGGILSGITDKIFGKGAFGDDTGLQAAGTTLTTAGTLLTTAATALQTAAASLSLSGAGSSAGSLFGGGDFGSLLDSGVGSAFGLPMFADGTPMIQRSGLAVVHKGEAVIPASMNKAGKMGGNISVNNQFVLSGPMDTRTQAQIAMQSRRSVEQAARRNG